MSALVLDIYLSFLKVTKSFVSPISILEQDARLTVGREKVVNLTSGG